MTKQEFEKVKNNPDVQPSWEAYWYAKANQEDYLYKDYFDNSIKKGKVDAPYTVEDVKREKEEKKMVWKAVGGVAATIAGIVVCTVFLGRKL